MLKKTIKNIRSKKESSLLMQRFADYTDLFFNKDITFYPKFIDSIRWNKILVLTPHADDETLGCGGFLYKASQKNRTIKVILYSDNSESINNADNNNVIESRSEEFCNAMQMLNINDKTELRLSPIEFILSQKAVDLTSKHISNFSPDLILLPSFIDNHEEHKTLNRIFAKAIEKLNSNIEILLFEVWNAGSPNLILDISDCISRKINAISCYKSQLENINYADAIIGLNKYRSITHLKGKGYCEGFVHLTAEEYLKLVNKYL